MADTADLRRILEAINAAWTTAQTESLHSVFHPEMVIAGPRYQQFAAGRNACVESYREFSANAEVLIYSTSEPTITVWGNTAVCSYSWAMKWQRDGDPVSDTGTDQFVFSQIDGQWLAVYRLVLFQQAAA